MLHVSIQPSIDTPTHSHPSIQHVSHQSISAKLAVFPSIESRSLPLHPICYPLRLVCSDDLPSPRRRRGRRCRRPSEQPPLRSSIRRSLWQPDDSSPAISGMSSGSILERRIHVYPSWYVASLVCVFVNMCVGACVEREIRKDYLESYMYLPILILSYFFFLRTL